MNAPLSSLHKSAIFEPNFTSIESLAKPFTAKSIQIWQLAHPAKALELPRRLGLTVGTINMLDPVVAKVTGFNRNTHQRFQDISTAFSKGQVPLLACQEAGKASTTALIEQGYSVVGMDLPAMRPDYVQDQVQQEQTLQEQAQQSQTSQASFWSKLSSRWTGVQCCFDSQRFRLDPDHKPVFYAYPVEYQKNWSHVFEAVWRLMAGVLQHLISPSYWLQACSRVFESLSGPLRLDGLLVTPLQNQLTHESVIFCASHLESFERSIAQQQLTMVIQRLKALQAQHPEATLVLAADFNWQVGPGENTIDFNNESISARLERELGAVTVPFEAIAPTLVGQRKAIDGVFYVPPKGFKGEVRGLTLDPVHPGESVTEALSDHFGVVTQLRLTHNWF